jgi:transcriptional regulator PpsR
MKPPFLTASNLERLADLAPALAATYAAVAGDVAVVISRDGLIAEVALGDSSLGRHAQACVGLPFIDRFTVESRGKIAQLLVDVGCSGISRRREVNLIDAEGGEVPVSFAAIRLGADGPFLAVGRDLRAIAAIQQRFVEAQQELEREYWQQRQAESRYRQLFQVATDAVMVVDARTLTIVEANRAASELFGCTEAQLIGAPATTGLAPSSRAAVAELLAIARESGRPAEIRARLIRQPERQDALEVDVSATPFRAADGGAKAMLLLMRARASGSRAADSAQRLADFVEHTPDGVVITDSMGCVQFANPAFLAMCATSRSESQIKGRTLAEVLGLNGQRLAPLLDEVRRNGIATPARMRIGHAAAHATDQAALEVEVSAMWLDESDRGCIGFTLRRPVVRSEASPPMVSGLAGAIESLFGQLGQVSLPELMHEASRLVERHLIENALVRSGGYAGSAAEWLGVSPESLALCLQNHGLSSEREHGEPPGLLN